MLLKTGRFTETALVELTNLIHKSLKDKEIAASAYIDIEGAFDNTHKAIKRIPEPTGVGRTTSR